MVMKFSKEYKIGLFVVVVITASFFLINYLRGEDIFNREFEISARYSDVEGLVASAPVYIKGYKAGKVVSVEYEPASDDFMVTCSIMKEFRVPVDSRMTIYGVDIMGGKGIKVELGTAPEMIENGGEIHGATEPALLDGLAGEVAPLMDKVGRTLDSLNVTVASVNRILADGNITRTLAHIERTMADVSRVAASLDGKSAELDLFIDNLADLSSKFVVIAEKADTMVTDLSSTVSQISGDDLREVVSSFRSLLEKINDPDGTMGRLLKDDSVYDSLDSLLDDVDTLVRNIQENPKKYIKISVF